VSQLPKRIAKFAPHLAAMNPIAFSDETVALKSLENSWKYIQHADTISTSTGGYKLDKDSDGEITLWVSPNLIWKDV